MIQQPSREIQRYSESFISEVQDPSFIFSESTYFQHFILDISYGPYEGWVPCSASGEI